MCLMGAGHRLNTAMCCTCDAAAPEQGLHSLWV
jgi:hypothetical protein